jgi:hypothetical protein
MWMLRWKACSFCAEPCPPQGLTVAVDASACQQSLHGAISPPQGLTVVVDASDCQQSLHGAISPNKLPQLF